MRSIAVRMGKLRRDTVTPVQTGRCARGRSCSARQGALSQNMALASVYGTDTVMP